MGFKQYNNGKREEESLHVSIYVYIPVARVEEVYHEPTHDNDRALVAYIFKPHHFTEKRRVGVIDFSLVEYHDGAPEKK